MNTEAEKVNQVTDSLSTVKTNVETLSKDLSEIRETAKSSDSKVPTRRHILGISLTCSYLHDNLLFQSTSDLYWMKFI